MAVTKIRGNTQIVANSISSGQVDASLIVAGGTNAFTADQSLGGFRLTNAAAPVAAGDLTNKTYVDGLVNGLNWKAAVRVASTANVPLTGGTTLTIDGVALANGNRVLLKDQATGSQNGIYTVSGIGTGYLLTRAPDADTSPEVKSGMAAFVTEGATNANSQWSLTTDDPITLDTTSLTFAQVGGSTSVTADEVGLHLAGTVLSPIFGTTAGTIAQGNDARLSNARTPVGTALSSAQIWVGSAGNVAAPVALSGDATVTAAGVVTVANQIKVSKFVVRETPSGTVNGSNVAFTLANAPVAGTESLYLNGILQDAGAGNDYTIAGNTITMLTAPSGGDKLRANYVSQ